MSRIRLARATAVASLALGAALALPAQNPFGTTFASATAAAAESEPVAVAAEGEDDWAWQR